MRSDFESVVLVIINGDVDNQNWLIERSNDAEQIVVADGGTRHVYAVGIVPDVVVGDMDSTAPEIQTWLDNNAVKQILYSAEKDETDFELTIQYVLEHFSAPIRIVGAIGGRIDHMLANIMLLARPNLLGRDIRIVTQHQEMFITQGVTTIFGFRGDRLSLIPLTDDTRIASVKGLKWPLKNETLYLGSGRGVSNELTSHSATVSIEKGLVACILTKKNWAR